MPVNEMSVITENLLKVYSYAFIEDATYGFYKPNESIYESVRLVDKEYHCNSCNKFFKVKIRNDNDGIIYFSKDKIAEQKRVYEELGEDFPNESKLEKDPFSYKLIGTCRECAREKLLATTEVGQRITNLCHELYLQDMLVSDKAKQYMTDAVSNWLASIKEQEELNRFDLSNPDIVRELIWIMVISDTEACEEALAEYRRAIEPLLSELESLLLKATPGWKAYTAKSTSLPESMSAGEYHEYTLAFPANDTQGQDFYFRKKIDKARVEMFVEQRRISSLQELLVDAGFQEKWIDMVADRVIELGK